MINTFQSHYSTIPAKYNQGSLLAFPFPSSKTLNSLWGLIQQHPTLDTKFFFSLSWLFYRISQTWWLRNNKNLLLIFWKLGNHSAGPLGVQSGAAWFTHSSLLPVTYMTMGEWVLWGLFYNNTNPPTCPTYFPKDLPFYRCGVFVLLLS